MRALQIGTFEASLGLIAIGILLVDGNANIIHDSSILAKHFSWKNFEMGSDRHGHL